MYPFSQYRAAPYSLLKDFTFTQATQYSIIKWWDESAACFPHSTDSTVSLLSTYLPITEKDYDVMYSLFKGCIRTRTVHRRWPITTSSSPPCSWTPPTPTLTTSSPPLIHLLHPFPRHHLSPSGKTRIERNRIKVDLNWCYICIWSTVDFSIIYRYQTRRMSRI